MEEEAETTLKIPLVEHVANVADKAHKALKALPPRRPAEASARPAWFRLFLPTEFLSQRLEMPVRGFKTICRSNPGRQTC